MSFYTAQTGDSALFNKHNLSANNNWADSISDGTIIDIWDVENNCSTNRATYEKACCVLLHSIEDGDRYLIYHYGYGEEGDENLKTIHIGMTVYLQPSDALSDKPW